MTTIRLATAAELSIQVDKAVHRSGVGQALLTALIDVAGDRAVHVLVAGIDADNKALVAFHEALDFVQVASTPEVGHKHGHWLDLVLVQRILP